MRSPKPPGGKGALAVVAAIGENRATRLPAFANRDNTLHERNF